MKLWTVITLAIPLLFSCKHPLEQNFNRYGAFDGSSDLEDPDGDGWQYPDRILNGGPELVLRIDGEEVDHWSFANVNREISDYLREHQLNSGSDTYQWYSRLSKNAAGKSQANLGIIRYIAHYYADSSDMALRSHLTGRREIRVDKSELTRLLFEMEPEIFRVIQKAFADTTAEAVLELTSGLYVIDGKVQGKAFSESSNSTELDISIADNESLWSSLSDIHFNNPLNSYIAKVYYQDISEYFRRAMEIRKRDPARICVDFFDFTVESTKGISITPKTGGNAYVRITVRYYNNDGAFDSVSRHQIYHRWIVPADGNKVVMHNRVTYSDISLQRFFSPGTFHVDTSRLTDIRVVIENLGFTDGGRHNEIPILHLSNKNGWLGDKSDLDSNLVQLHVKENDGSVRYRVYADYSPYYKQLKESK